MKFDYHLAVDHWHGEDVTKAQRILRNVIPRNLTSGGLDATVSVAGSSALSWYQNKHHVGPKWKLLPRVTDVFVCLDTWEFRELMLEVESELKISGHKCTHEMYENDHAIRYYPTFVHDIRIEGLHAKIRFVESPFRNMLSTINNFDIDVCKVTYGIHDGQFRLCSEAVGKAIRTGRASFKRPPPFVEEHWRGWEKIKCERTTQRMLEYAARGFTFQEPIERYRALTNYAMY